MRKRGTLWNVCDDLLFHIPGKDSKSYGLQIIMKLWSNFRAWNNGKTFSIFIILLNQQVISLVTQRYCIPFPSKKIIVSFTSLKRRFPPKLQKLFQRPQILSCLPKPLFSLILISTLEKCSFFLLKGNWYQIYLSLTYLMFYWCFHKHH
jgi:hypothetical protein